MCELLHVQACVQIRWSSVGIRRIEHTGGVKRREWDDERCFNFRRFWRKALQSCYVIKVTPC